MTTAWLAQTRAISSSATTYAAAPAPLPPHRSGMTMPMSPSSPIRLTVSWGKRQSRSISAAIGLIWVSANSRAVARISSCSDVRSNVTSPCLFLQELLELFRELGDDLEEVGHDPEVGDLEDRRLRILVDRDDDLRGAHARQVLDRARHAEAEIELGRDRAAGLADLEAMWPPAGVHCRARGADRGADDAAELFEDHVVLGALHAAPAGDDGLGLGELGQPGRDFLAPLDELPLRAGRGQARALDRGGLARLTLGRTEHVGPQRRDPWRLRPRHPREQLAGVDRSGRDELVAFHRKPHRVGREAHAELRG